MPEPSAASFLKSKVGGIPVWAIGGVVAAGAVGFIWYQNRKTTKPTDQNALGTAAGTAAAAPPIYVSTPPSTATSGSSSTSPTITPPPQPVWQNGTPTVPHVWQSTGQNAPQGFPAHQALPGPSNPVTSPNAYPGFGDYSWEWSPVPSGSDPSGNPWTPFSYAAALNSAGMGGMVGMGGIPGPAETPWHRFNQQHHVPSYWAAGMGGAGAGHTKGGHVSRLAKQLGMSPARLQSLNPQLRNQNFRHFPGQLIKVG